LRGLSSPSFRFPKTIRSPGRERAPLAAARAMLSCSGMDLTRQQAEILGRLQEQEFQVVAFPMYASYIGVRKGSCAALLAPVGSSGFTVFGAPTYMVGENLGARVKHQDGEWFVWKKERVEATPQRVGELEQFSAELAAALTATV
jgi:hypothetical protein